MAKYILGLGNEHAVEFRRELRLWCGRERSGLLWRVRDL